MKWVVVFQLYHITCQIKTVCIFKSMDETELEKIRNRVDGLEAKQRRKHEKKAQQYIEKYRNKLNKHIPSKTSPDCRRSVRLSGKFSTKHDAEIYLKYLNEHHTFSLFQPRIEEWYIFGKSCWYVECDLPSWNDVYKQPTKSTNPILFHIRF